MTRVIEVTRREVGRLAITRVSVDIGHCGLRLKDALLGHRFGAGWNVGKVVHVDASCSI
jgi:hypothetical protein